MPAHNGDWAERAYTSARLCDVRGAFNELHGALYRGANPKAVGATLMEDVLPALEACGCGKKLSKLRRAARTAGKAAVALAFLPK